VGNLFSVGAVVNGDLLHSELRHGPPPRAEPARKTGEIGDKSVLGFEPTLARFQKYLLPAPSGVNRNGINGERPERSSSKDSFSML
jgi:hypothetical protein